MAVMQYIGARYVPLFYEGSNGAEWDPGVVYEPLTIVTYIGFSWTSKKKVPATVGAPNLNPEYWVNTGNYNEGINELREEVDELREDLEDLDTAYQEADTAITTDYQAADTNLANDIDGITGHGVFAGRIILIGDSYAEGYTPSGTVEAWPITVRNYSGCKSAIIKYKGGCGFARANEGVTFLTLLQQAIDEIPTAQKSEYSAVIIGGGYNDFNMTAADIRSGIHACANYVKNNLPSARFIVAYMGWSRYPDTQSVTARRYTRARYTLALTGITAQYIDDAYMALAISEQSRMSSDGKHPSKGGQDAIAAHIISCANGGKVSYETEETPIIVNNLNYYISKGEFCLNVYGSLFLTPTTINNIAYTGSSLNASLDNISLPFSPPSGSVPYNGVTIPGILNYTDTNQVSKYAPCSITLRVNENRGLNIYVACLNEGGTGWLAAANTMNSIFIPLGVYRFKIDEL